MKKKLALIIFYLSTLVVYGQNIEWQKSFGGSGDDQINEIQQTSDGGYIIAGWSESTNGDITGNQGDSDFWVVKLNSLGSISWQKSLGSAQYDDAFSIEQTTDGGYILGGRVSANGGDVTGYHGGEDGWLAKLDGTGNLTWQKSLGGSGSDVPRSIRQTLDGGYIVGGVSTSSNGDVSGGNGSGDYWVVKLSSSGTIVWQQALGGTAMDYCYSVQQTLDGGYVVAGRSASNNGDVTGNHGNADFWVVKLDNSGVITWQKSLGGSGDDRGRAIKPTMDGGYIVSGWSESTDGDVTGNNGSYDFWMVKLSSFGIIQWESSLGGSANDRSRTIIQTSDGGYIVAGESESVNGDITNNQGLKDCWVVKLNSSTAISEQKFSFEPVVSPNPSMGFFKFGNIKEESTLYIHDSKGREIVEMVINHKSSSVSLEKEKKGIYFYRIESKNKFFTGKLIKR